MGVAAALSIQLYLYLCTWWRTNPWAQGVHGVQGVQGAHVGTRGSTWGQCEAQWRYMGTRGWALGIGHWALTAPVYNVCVLKRGGRGRGFVAVGMALALCDGMVTALGIGVRLMVASMSDGEVDTSAALEYGRHLKTC